MSARSHTPPLAPFLPFPCRADRMSPAAGAPAFHLLPFVDDGCCAHILQFTKTHSLFGNFAPGGSSTVDREEEEQPPPATIMDLHQLFAEVSCPATC